MENTEINGHRIKINFRGGIVPAGELLDILNIAESAGVTAVRFGNRQQLIFNVAAEELEDVKNDLLIADLDYELNADEYPNMISSYVTEDIIYNANWLKEGVYKDIIDLFGHKPRLKINIADNSQTFIPFFTGNLNFISSNTSNYWYLYVRFPKTSILYCWPSLIYSDDIPVISYAVENEIMAKPHLFYDQQQIDGGMLHEQVNLGQNIAVQAVDQPLQLPEFSLPYYEGFNRYGNNRLWLGVYRRNELFPVDFLKDICSLCLETRIGQLYTTPWKSIVIKGIEQQDRGLWGKILNRHVINVRHAANELNWQVEELCDEGLQLKQQLVKEFEEADLRTFRLCFAVKTQRKSGLFGSVIINKQHHKREHGLFEILYTPNFNPNSKEFISFKKNLKQHELSASLIELCKYFYVLNTGEVLKTGGESAKAKNPLVPTQLYSFYQCKHCLTIYDEKFGCEENEVTAETKFETIDTYFCPVCEAPKSDFLKTERAVL
jgi:rubredoxin